MPAYKSNGVPRTSDHVIIVVRMNLVTLQLATMKRATTDEMRNLSRGCAQRRLIHAHRFRQTAAFARYYAYGSGNQWRGGVLFEAHALLPACSPFGETAG